MVSSSRALRRRTSLTAVLATPLLLAVCGQSPTPQVIVPAGAPPPQKIQRLIVRLPASEFIDEVAIKDEFKVQFAARGVAVEVAVSKPLELDRREALQALVGQFKPTNLIEFAYKSTTTQGGYSGRQASLFLIGTLIDMKGRTLRQVVLPIRGAASKALVGRRFVDELLAQLQQEGYV